MPHPKLNCSTCADLIQRVDLERIKAIELLAEVEDFLATFPQEPTTVTLLAKISLFCDSQHPF